MKKISISLALILGVFTVKSNQIGYIPTDKPDANIWNKLLYWPCIGMHNNARDLEKQLLDWKNLLAVLIQKSDDKGILFVNTMVNNTEAELRQAVKKMQKDCPASSAHGWDGQKLLSYGKKLPKNVIEVSKQLEAHYDADAQDSYLYLMRTNVLPQMRSVYQFEESE